MASASRNSAAAFPSSTRAHAGCGAPTRLPFAHLSNCVSMRAASTHRRSASGIGPRQSGHTSVSLTPRSRMPTTQPRQKRWPHGSVCGCCRASRQMTQSSPPALAPPPPPKLCTATATAGGAAATRAALLGASALTHLCLCPAFQCFLWHVMLQYTDSWHPPQRLLAPSLPQHSHTGIACAHTGTNRRWLCV